MDVSTKLESIASVGIRKMGKQKFALMMLGQQAAELMKLLEEQAVQAANYLDVRRAVGLAEIIRDQLREQGYYRSTERLYDEDGR